jgi:hypothetical protein
MTRTLSFSAVMTALVLGLGTSGAEACCRGRRIRHRAPLVRSCAVSPCAAPTVAAAGIWICYGKPIPAGYVITGWRHDPACGDIPSAPRVCHGMHIEPAREGWVCVESPVPPGYVVTAYGRQLGCCGLPPSPFINNAKYIKRR